MNFVIKAHDLYRQRPSNSAFLNVLMSIEKAKAKAETPPFVFLNLNNTNTFTTSHSAKASTNPFDRNQRSHQIFSSPQISAVGSGMSATSIHITALDGIVNVNSLFTLAVFIGLAWNPTDPNNSLIDPTQQPGCAPSSRVAEQLVAFHVYSFSCFLFSSLVALGLKQAIRMSRSAFQGEAHWAFDRAHVNMLVLRVGYVVSAVGSVCGSIFLMLALINVVQIKLGTLGCGSGSHGYGAVVPLVILVPSGLLIYVCIVFYAFTR